MDRVDDRQPEVPAGLEYPRSSHAEAAPQHPPHVRGDARQCGEGQEGEDGEREDGEPGAGVLRDQSLFPSTAELYQPQEFPAGICLA